MYRSVHTRLYLPLVLGMRCYPSFPIAQFRGPCAECYGPIQNSAWPFPLSYRAGFASGGQEDRSLSASIQAALTLECVTGETQYSNPCTEWEPPQSRYWDQQVASIAPLMSKIWYIQVCIFMSNVYIMYIHIHDVPREQWGHEPWRKEMYLYLPVNTCIWHLFYIVCSLYISCMYIYILTMEDTCTWYMHVCNIHLPVFHCMLVQ